MLHNIKQLTIANWKKESIKFLYWILGFNMFILLAQIIVFILSDYSLSGLLSIDIIISYLHTTLLPIVAITSIFFFKTLFYKSSDSVIWGFTIKIIGLVIGIFIGTVINEYIGYTMSSIDDDDYITLGIYTLSPLISNFIENQLIALVIGLLIFYKEALTDKIERTLKLKEAELKKVYQLKVKSELDAIHAKINPHFLYNSLNSIVSLIHDNPDKAETMVLSLSDLFRYSINSKGSDFASIEEEINLVRTYLEIEHVRFQDQLSYDIIVEEGLEHVDIPKFLIQPLIENAIKHGTSKIQEGIIKLHITSVNNDILISVFDNGSSFPEEIDSGYGLKSTVDKLDLLYKGDYSFQLINSPEKHIKITLKNIYHHEKNL